MCLRGRYELYRRDGIMKILDYSNIEAIGRKEADLTEIDQQYRQDMWRAAKLLYNLKSKDQRGFWELMDNLFERAE